MIADNYYYAGTTAIIYKNDIYTNASYIANKSSIDEVGFMVKKESDSTWTTIPLVNINSNYNTELTEGGYTYLYSGKSGGITNSFRSDKWPMYIIIKNLEEETTYNLKIYYKIGTSYTYFNSCSATTMKKSSTVTYVCTVRGGDSSQNARFQEIMNTACDIYNSMTAFENNHSDYLNTQYGGSFTATITAMGEGVGADSGMNFTPLSNLGTAVHEMAHNLMCVKDLDAVPYYYDGVNENECSETFKFAVKKFMEFATNVEGATWKWQSIHNYPVISSADYGLAENYLVAAACWVSWTS